MPVSPRHTLTAAFVLVLGVGVYEAVQFFRQGSELRTLRRQADFLTTQIERTQRQQASTSTYREGLEREISAQLVVGDDDAPTLETEIRTWLEKIDRLKRLVADHPELTVPEMALLTEANWFDAAHHLDLDQRRLFALLRGLAVQRLAPNLRAALIAYGARHGGSAPDDISQLLPFINSPVEADWLLRYTLTPDENGRPRIIGSTISAKTAPIDLELDQVWSIGVNSTQVTPAADFNVIVARQAFARAHPEQDSVTAAQLLPYLRWPMSEELVRQQLPPGGVIRLR